MNPERHQCSMCCFEWKHGANGEHSCAETLLANITALKFENERLQAHNAMLVEALSPMEESAAQIFNVHGYTGMAELARNVKMARNATAESIQQWLDKHDDETSMLAGANALEQLLDKFAFFKSEDGLWLADGIAVMAEEMRKK